VPIIIIVDVDLLVTEVPIIIIADGVDIEGVLLDIPVPMGIIEELIDIIVVS
jgi:hypothetical protein